MTPHIINADGRDYDLTELTEAFGLLPDAVQDALLEWPHGWTRYDGYGFIPCDPQWANTTVYRAVQQ